MLLWPAPAASKLSPMNTATAARREYRPGGPRAKEGGEIVLAGVREPRGLGNARWAVDSFPG